MSTPDPNALLSCRDVSLAYDRVQVLFGVDLDIHEGEIVALLGTNGAGKSTLLKAISGLASPFAGTLTFDGRDITKLGTEDKVKAGVVQMPGGRSVFPTLTVAENLRAATWLLRRDGKAAASAVEEALDRFPALRNRIDQLAGNLSGGEQQMLGLGMAFIAAPRLLMIDELSLGLAPTIVEELLDIVRAVHDRGTTLVLVEQSVNVALTIAERAVFMEKGQVRFEGPTADLLERDDILRSVFLAGAVDDLEATADDRRSPAVAGADGGEDVTGVDGPPVVAVDDLSIRFGGVQAVREATFSVDRGEILGLIGPNGAGKTTIFDLISGFLTPTDGRIHFDGNDVTDWPADQRARAGLGRSFQDARIFPSMSVAENIALSLERHLEVRDHLAASLSLPAVRIEEESIAWTVDDLVELLGLGAFRSKLVGELSTGSRRIVDIAMAIAHDPVVLLLDEPSSGVAQKETEALAPLLLRIREEAGCAMLVIEHDMPMLAQVSDRMLALEQGSVVTSGDPHDVLTHPVVVASYLGQDDRVNLRSGADSGNGAPSSSTSSTRRRPRRQPLRTP